MRRLCLLMAFLLSLGQLQSQDDYPQDYFRSPLDIPLVLSGTFGELRSNHFHSGIDIKTQQRQGLPVFAIADGTVTRIKVSLFGYGKALYVAHPNGHTSVYAHLKKYGPKIEEYLKKVQYAKKVFELELFPEFGELEVKKGDIIAYTGNTGGSFGPHLHFEIRKSVSEKPTNPLLYGFQVRDATNPSLVGLYGFSLSEEAHINQSGERIQLNFSKRQDGTFVADPVTALGNIGFGFNGFDRQDMAANKNGIYGVKQLVNGTVLSSYRMDIFSFGETRYINTLIDYSHYSKYRQRIQKLFKEPANRLSIYDDTASDGILRVVDGMSYQVELQLEDFEGNQTRVLIPVTGKKETLKAPKETFKTDYYVEADKPSSFKLGSSRVYFPKGSFYKDLYLDLSHQGDTVTVHNNSAALHRNFTLTFDVKKFSSAARKQLFIARLDKEGRPRHSRTFKKGDTFTTRTKTLGKYTLVKDTTPPTIRPRNFKEGQWLAKYPYIKLTIADDLSGIDTYSATLNGQWILMEYETKNNTLTHFFDDKIPDGTQCTLKVVVTDNVGNTQTFEGTFFKK
ncbi:MAG: M23 family metallopeptidase [Bacteroidota bacterium]